MQAVYGDQCVDVSTVRRWVRRFKMENWGKQISKTKNQFFKDGFKKLVQRWWKCTKIRGDFVEK